MGAAPAGAGSVPHASAAANDLTLVAPGGRALGGPWQRWARASLMPTVRGRVTVHLSGCPALPRAAGCVYRQRPHTIYVRQGVRRPRAVLLHELGHLFDLRVMNNRDRGRFGRIMHAGRRRWWAGKLPLAEQFAEAYSFCARYRRIVAIGRVSTDPSPPSPAPHPPPCPPLARPPLPALRALRPPAPGPRAGRPGAAGPGGHAPRSCAPAPAVVVAR